MNDPVVNEESLLQLVRVLGAGESETDFLSLLSYSGSLFIHHLDTR